MSTLINIRVIVVDSKKVFSLPPNLLVKAPKKPSQILLFL